MKPGHSPPDPTATALQEARNGDLQAFEQLVRQYQTEVFTLALQLTGQHAATSELAQDVLVDLHAAMPRIASHRHLSHWLSRSVAQRAADRPWHPADESASAATLSDPGAEFTARVMARVELRWSHRRADFAPARFMRKPRWRSSGIVAGAVAFIGIAATLALWTSGQLHKPQRAAVALPEANAAGNAPQVSAPARSAATPAASTSTRPATPRDTFPQYTVVVLPLRHASLDADSLVPAEAFHAALITELRTVPGIVLLVPGVTAPPDTLQSADYLLTVTSLAARTLPSGGTAFRITGNGGAGSLSAGWPASGRHWPVEIRIRPTRQSRSAGFTSTLQVGEDSASLPELAAQQVALLRARMLPDALVKQQLMATIRDASLTAMERNSALDNLLGIQRDRGTDLNSIDAGIIVAGAAALPADERARLWRSLRGVSNAELVDTLAESMRRDPDTSVRFEALATLAADYASEARVRTAIDTVSREDPSQVMRMAARRAQHGDDEWRNYLVTALKDMTLPLPERLAPLLLAGQSATTAAEVQRMRTITNDEEIVNALAGMIRDNWFDYTQTQAIGDALDLMASAGNTAAPDLLVEIPQVASRAAVTASTPASQVSPAAMSWLLKNRNNPRARRMLDDIARGRVDPQLDLMIEQMQQRAPPRRQ